MVPRTCQSTREASHVAQTSRGLMWCFEIYSLFGPRWNHKQWKGMKAMFLPQSWHPRWDVYLSQGGPVPGQLLRILAVQQNSR
ncbi:uncharacterized protein LOC128350090 isoform X2 [Hemicordylus capensis]|uniref:uncharacterized protein LOC128350090 isoform X2 n=1 Tax=Hemicordylus capensis TaxID=884348 RepID=UPI002303B838|nr:uncharacterized protein LOC128350090 isoform X2 [Hemicordylus capensis]